MDMTKRMSGALNGSNQFAMVTNNMYMLVLYNLVQHFFSGFITAKLPFDLTFGWKHMFQAGINLTSLDVAYVSSSSWYILIFTGLRGLTGVVNPPIIFSSVFRDHSPQMLGGVAPDTNKFKALKNDFGKLIHDDMLLVEPVKTILGTN